MIFAESGSSNAFGVLVAIIVASASIVVGYWNSHTARRDAAIAKVGTSNATQKAAYAAHVATSAREQIESHSVDADVVAQFRDTIANMANAQAELQRETNAQLAACRASEAKLATSNDLLTISNRDLKDEVTQLRLELADVRRQFETILLENRDDNRRASGS